VLDREVDGAVVAELEMEEGEVADAAPIAAIERVVAAQIEGAGDETALPLGHDQHDLVGHALSQEVEKFAVQVGRSPFAVRGRDEEAEEGVPMPRPDGIAGQRRDGEAAGERIAPLPPDRLALARAQRLEIGIEARIAGILPMELPA